MKISRNISVTAIFAAGLAFAVATGNIATAATGDAPLGSPDFRPSADRSFGWRGDGSGQFPGATPPVNWGRTAAGVKGLRSQATKPKEGETGKPIPDGVIREWLVLGPVPLAEEKNFTREWMAQKPALLAEEGNSVKGLDGKADISLSPDENDKAVNLSWGKVKTDGALLDFSDLYAGKVNPTSNVAFAHAYLYSESKTKFRLIKEIDVVGGGNSIKAYVNGALIKDPEMVPPRDFVLEKGWNRILLRVACGGVLVPAQKEKGIPARLSWYVQPIIHGVPKSEYVNENIRWTARLPGWSIASPVIAGDKIFAVGERRTLSCFDKATGKILWTRTATFYDAATDEEKKANPELFKELEPLVARLAEVDKMFTTNTLPDPDKIIVEKANLETKIEGLMCKVDKAKYEGKAGPIGEPGYASRTPVTDGENIYVNYHPCLTACYDMDGNRKWVHQHAIGSRCEHGIHTSPCLIGGKLIVDTDKYIALDAKTGKVAWEQPGRANSSSLLGATVNGEAMVFSGGPCGFGYIEDIYGGQMSAIRVKDGSVISKPGPNHVTPVIQGNMIYSLRSLSGRNMETLDIRRITPEKLELVKTITIDCRKFMKMSRLEMNLASPLYYEGLLYIVDADGLLSVVDAEKYEVVYQKILDIDNGPGGVSRGVQGSSPALGGKYIYVFGSEGACVVLEPGRQFRQVAKNRIETYCTGFVYWGSHYGTQMEQTLSCPIFDGNRMYYTGLINLYCIEEQKGQK